VERINADIYQEWEKNGYINGWWRQDIYQELLSYRHSGEELRSVVSIDNI
jgi:hypothetical protein